MTNQSLEFKNNEDAMKLLLSDLRRITDQVKLGGGKKAIEKHKEKGKMTARERIEALLDKGRPVLEVGELAG